MTARHSLRASSSYLAAGLKVLSLGHDALVVIDVVLPAVLGLVLVREAGVEACDGLLDTGSRGGGRSKSLRGCDSGGGC